jgi:hypothetical protein
LWASEGESFFWGFLRREEETAAEYRRWFPRLQAYAAGGANHELWRWDGERAEFIGLYCIDTY